MNRSRTRLLLESAQSQRLAGNWQDAVALSQQAFHLSWQLEDAEQVMEAVLAVAHAYREKGEGDLAAEHYDLAHTVATLLGSAGPASRALNGKGIVLQERGEMDRAEAAYTQARELALPAGDALTIGNIELNLGTLAAIRGDVPAAHALYASCLVRYESIAHDRGVVGVLNNLGMLYIDSGRLEEAAESFDRALTICRQGGDVLSEGTVQINRTELLIAQGQLDAARSTCDDAFEIFSRFDEASGRSEALKHYGVIYRETGKLYLAEVHLRDAIRIAADGGYPLQEAESRRELALVWRLMGRNKDALEALNRSYSLFTKLQASPDKADIRQRLKQLEEDFLSVVSYWSESIDEIDGYTRGHCQRVAGYACLLAEEVGFSAEELVWFRMGALLHDVGKTLIPRELLNKPGDLLPDERELIEKHTVLGEELLAAVEFPWNIRPMIRSHHERWDGTGYPDGLAGESIPLAARILHIADVFDALTTTRSYRTRLDPIEAVEVMLSDVNSFDSRLLEAFTVLVSRSGSQQARLSSLEASS